MDRVFTVLIADDEPHIRAVVGMKLRSAGLTVVEGRDGREALELAALRRPDLVVTDLQMPNMSGLEMAQTLKRTEAGAATPLVMLTARGHIIPPEELAKTNIRQLLEKPFSAKHLLERVMYHLGVRPSEQAAAA